ncbi:hypothetical protein FH972_021462 [Carpinus fangiana]|uniref:Major facilitator superfamily (MFS) profile domain-containing protein n=1 Tax=Carpinus fangiana TaxID=176857 RepID=A0A5N6KPE4_9ROSI|nr:hypothetical protein FH972_021462 [Carpinus fangiana]
METDRVNEIIGEGLKAPNTLPVLTRQRTRPLISYHHEYAFVAIVSGAQLFTQAALSMSIAPLFHIGDTFDVSNPGQLSWTVAAYSLTVGTFVLPAGRVGEIFGYKPVFIAGTLWCAMWSLIAGLSSYSHSIIFFDFCRAMQGIGPSFMLPNAIAIFGSTYPPGRRKDFIFGLFGATAPSGFNVGAFSSAILAQRLSWEWAYYLMSIACCLEAALAFFIIPEYEGVSVQRETGFTLSRLDPLGTLTGVIGLVLVNIAWNQGPVIGWHVPYVYTVLIMGCAFIGVFFYIEGRVEHPLVPIKRVNINGCFVLACTAAGWASFGIWVFYLWEFLLVIRNQSPFQTAIQSLTWSVTGLVASVTAGMSLSRVQPSFLMLIAMLGFLVGNILVATQPVNQTFWAQTFIAFLVTPWGMDMSFPSATVIISDCFPPHEQGTAASMVTTILNYSISIGLGIAGTIESKIEPTGEDKLRGYRSAWYFAIGISGLGVLTALAFNLLELVRAHKKREDVESWSDE